VELVAMGVVNVAVSGFFVIRATVLRTSFRASAGISFSPSKYEILQEKNGYTGTVQEKAHFLKIHFLQQKIRYLLPDLIVTPRFEQYFFSHRIRTLLRGSAATSSLILFKNSYRYR
jgi:hypothetical protein